MIYFYTIFLTGIFLINEQIGLPSFIVLGASIVLYAFIYMHITKESSQFVAIIAMMIVSLPFSWNPLWGGTIGSNFTWYYFWATVIIILMFPRFNLFLRLKLRLIVILSIITFFYSVIPLVLSQSLVEGIKEYLMIGYLLIVLIGASLSVHRITERDRENLVNVFIFTMAIIGGGMIIQFIGYYLFGLHLFGFKLAYSWNNQIQTGCHLLMEDASSGTIMLGAGSMLALIYRKQNKINYLWLTIIVIGMACSGRRTGIVTLLFIMAIYLIIGTRRIKEKVGYSILFSLLGGAIVYFLNLSRGVDSASRLLDGNGRFQLLDEGIQLFFKKPILGYGYDNFYMENTLMPSKMIVHNTVIRWLDMGGIILGSLMVSLFVVWMLYLKKSKRNDFLWVIIYSLSASMLIPDLLNSRFMYVIAILSLIDVSSGGSHKKNVNCIKTHIKV